MATRRQQAVSFGADAAIDPTAGDLGAQTVEAFGGHAPRHVIECVGLPGIVQTATEVAATDGVVTIAGVCLAQDPLFPYFALSKELDLRYAFYYRRQDYELTIDAINRGHIAPAPVITDTISLQEVPERFEVLKKPSADIKVHIRP
jgi:(R,R)-butanediol dehydrogenase/meso-butanediol dehydrogenase/diacetyl reductase